VIAVLLIFLIDLCSLLTRRIQRAGFTAPSANDKIQGALADVAQLVEQPIRNRQVTGSSPVVGSKPSRLPDKLSEPDDPPWAFVHRRSIQPIDRPRAGKPIL
jgi:hypothetical protein